MSATDPFAPADDTPSPRKVGLDPDGNGEVDHLDGMRRPELQNLAGTLGLDTDGTRATLIQRIRRQQATQPLIGEAEQPAPDEG